MKTSFCLMILVIVSLQSANAEQSIKQGLYELHYNTFPSTFLDKKTATTYQIKRSKSRGILSITLMDLSKNPATAVEGKITITAKNLLGQSKTIDNKTIKENNGGIYYLNLFKMNNQENINFRIVATPTGSKQPITHEFTREFFID